MLDALLAPLGGLVGVLGGEMLRSIPEPALQSVEQGLVVRPRHPGAGDLVQPRLVRGSPRSISLVGRAVELDPVPAGLAEDERERESLSDKGDQDHSEREQQDQVPFRECRRQREGRRE